jgi:hypothetical protein
VVDVTGQLAFDLEGVAGGRDADPRRRRLDGSPASGWAIPAREDDARPCARCSGPRTWPWMGLAECLSCFLAGDGRGDKHVIGGGHKVAGKRAATRPPTADGSARVGGSDE